MKTLTEDIKNTILLFQGDSNNYSKGLMIRPADLAMILDIATIGMYHNEIVILKATSTEERIGHFEILQINGKKDWDYKDYDSNLDVSINEISIQFTYLDSEEKEETTVIESLVYIDQITLLERSA